MNKLEHKITDMQQELHEKNAQLKVASDQMMQFKKDIKNMEMENIKARSTIMRLEEKQSLKTKTTALKRNLNLKVGVSS